MDLGANEEKGQKELNVRAPLPTHSVTKKDPDVKSTSGAPDYGNGRASVAKALLIFVSYGRAEAVP